MFTNNNNERAMSSIVLIDRFLKESKVVGKYLVTLQKLDALIVQTSTYISPYVIHNFQFYY